MTKPVHWICAAALAVICVSAAKNSATRTLTVTEGTNVNVTVSPDHKMIIMDLQETLWSLPIAGGTANVSPIRFLSRLVLTGHPKVTWLRFNPSKAARFTSG
jgi:hypothetical protein